MVSWDARCRTVFGGSGEDIDYASILASVHPENREHMHQSVQKAVQPTSDGLYRCEYRVVWPDGSVHWVSGNGQAYFDGEGPDRHAVRLIGTVHDITGRKRHRASSFGKPATTSEKVAERTAELRRQRNVPHRNPKDDPHRQLGSGRGQRQVCLHFGGKRANLRIRPFEVSSCQGSRLRTNPPRGSGEGTRQRAEVAPRKNRHIGRIPSGDARRNAKICSCDQAPGSE